MKLIHRVTRFSIFLGAIAVSMAARSNDHVLREHATVSTSNASLSMVSNLRIDSLIPNVVTLPLAGADSLHRDSIRPAANKYVWLQGGVQADELFYPNERLHIGYGNVYAIVSWNEDCCLSHIRYGAGYVQPLAKGWQLHSTATLGFTKTRYPQSTTLPEVQVKNSLYKFGVIASKNVYQHLSIQAGAVMNALYTKYKSPDQQGLQQAIAVGTLLTDGMNGDNIYTSVEPPYTLFNTYKKERATNWKGWIGAEIGIYYTLSFSSRKQ